MKKLAPKLLFIAITALACLAAWFALRPGGPQRADGLGKSFEFDAWQNQTSESELPHYTEQAPIALPDLSVTSIAVDPTDRVILCTPQGLTLINPDRTSAKQIPLPFPALCATADTNGLLYVGSMGKLHILSTQGDILSTITLPQTNAMPSSVAVHNQHIFVADAENATVVQFDRSGRMIRTLEGFILFSSPGFDLTFDPDGFLWIANPGQRQIRKYSTDGLMVTALTHAGRDIGGFSGCCNPTDIAMLPNGSLVTSEKNILRVKILDPLGRVTAVVAGPESFSQKLHRMDIAVDSRGRVLILDTEKQQVRIFERQ